MQDNIVFKDWLSRRKISDSVIKEFNVHWGTNPTFGECIVIPISDDEGNFYFNKYRRNPLQKDITPKYIYDKGGKVTLYGADKIKDSKTILITEGEMDCLVAWSHKIPAVSGTGGALSFPEEWSKYFTNKEVIICFDNDEAGGEGMAKVINIIPHAKILFLPDRTGIKDISDYVQNGGDLHSLIRTAKRFSCLQDIIDDCAERQSVWHSTYFHDAYIKNHTKPTHAPRERNNNISDKVLRAKDYSITDLIKFQKEKARCIWHTEDTPSMHYYPDTNSVYCFGCGKHGDAIDVYQQMYKCSFKEAIEKLQ